MPPPLQIPKPSPNDLNNPVPNTPELDPSSYFKNIATPAPKAVNNPEDVQGFFKSIAQGGGGDNLNQNAPSVGNIPGGLFDQQPEGLGGEQQLNQGAQGLEGIKQAASITAQNIRDFGVNFLSNLKGSPEASLQVWKDAVGDENAKLTKGKIWFRWSKDEDFRPVTKGMFDGMANFISQHSKAATFIGAAAGTAAVAGPAVAAMVGPAAELTEGAGIGAQIAANFTPNALANAGVAGAAGGAAPAALSDVSQNLMGSKQAPGVGQTLADIGQGAATGAAENLGAHALLGVSAPPISEAYQGAKNIFKNNAWDKVENIYGDLRNVFKNSGMQLPESQKTLGTTLAGDVYPSYPQDAARVGVFDKIRNDMSKSIGVFVKDAEAAAAGKKFPVSDQLAQLRQMMERGGVRFTQGTKDLPAEGMQGALKELGINPSEINYSDLEGPIAKDLSEISSQINEGRKITTDFAVKPNVNNVSDNPYPWGEKSPENVNWMINYYNNLAAKDAAGGLSPSEITDFEQVISNKAFDEAMPPSNRLKAMMRSASYLFSTRQKDIVKEALSGSPEVGQAIDAAYNEYANKINPLREFVSRFQAQGSSSAFADKLIQPTNSEDVLALKNLLADEYPQVWAQVKGNWLSNLIKQNSDQNILNPKSLSDTLFGGGGSRGYDKEILDALFPAVEQANLKTSLRELSKIPTKKFLKSGDDEKLAVQATAMLISPFAKGYHTYLASKSVFNMLKQNGPMADYMAGEGFLKIAEKADSAAEKINILRVANEFKNDLAGAEKIPTPKIGYRYGAPIGAMAIEGMRQSGPKKEPTLGSVYGR